MMVLKVMMSLIMPSEGKGVGKKKNERGNDNNACERARARTLRFDLAISDNFEVAKGAKTHIVYIIMRL